MALHDGTRLLPPEENKQAPPAAYSCTSADANRDVNKTDQADGFVFRSVEAYTTWSPRYSGAELHVHARTGARVAPAPSHHAARPHGTLAAELWSPRNHATFPVAGRARAVELLRLGHQLAKAVRSDGETMSFVDVWVAQVMPRAIDRVDVWMVIRPMIRPRCVCLTEEW